jgi:poly(beta-D-mannuronate) lyase
MNPKNRIVTLSCLVASVLTGGPAFAAQKGLFDVAERKAQLKTPEYASIRTACLAPDMEVDDEELPKPFDGLKETEGYGTDRSASALAWVFMVHGGRALAGEQKSNDLVKKVLLEWAKADALMKTEEVHDAYYALKRLLLPAIESYMIVKDTMTKDEQKIVEDWIDPLVRKVDRRFDGDVDLNNHRYLADSVLALWGDFIGDKALYKKGRERFEIALGQMRPDGSLPLETRRGARALWYMRQAAADLTLIAEIYARNGEDLYSLEKDGKSLPLLVNYLVSASRSQLVVLPDASENYIPGPSKYFMNQDMEFLARRGGKRHYMAFAHIYIQHFGMGELSSARLNALMQETGFKELPLIDDYIGSNATCIWGKP